MKLEALALLIRVGLCSLGAFWTAASMGCGEGSYSEGDFPQPPCFGSRTSALYYQSILMRGHVADLGGGCVGVAIDAVVGGGSRVTQADGTVLLESSVPAGEIVRARLGQVYAYAYTFEVGDEVAALGGTWSDMLNLELMAVVNDNVRIQWVGRQFDMPLSDLTAMDCDARVRSQRDDEGMAISSRDGSSDLVVPDSPNCAD